MPVEGPQVRGLKNVDVRAHTSTHNHTATLCLLVHFLTCNGLIEYCYVVPTGGLRAS